MIAYKSLNRKYTMSFVHANMQIGHGLWSSINKVAESANDIVQSFVMIYIIEI